MAIQYYMRGYNTSAPGTVGYVDWVVNDTPDSTATYVPSPYVSGNIANIIVNRIVTSKVDNFLKPNESLSAIGISGSDGYFFHINSYDWLHTTPPGPPISVPSHLLGLSMVRGSADGITPRDYATLFWSESVGKWLFAYNTSGDGVTVGASLPVGMGSLSIDGYLELGANPAQSGIIRIPNNQFIVSRSANNLSDGYLIGQDNLNRVRLGSPPGNEIYIPGDLRVDGYIRDGYTSPATSGFIRNSNSTAIVTFKNLSNVDVTALSSSGNLVVLGDAVNAGVRFNTATGFDHIFEVNSTNLARVGNADGTTYFKFESTAPFPIISQIDRFIGNARDLKFKAQSTNNGIGGSAIISSGQGSIADGYVDIRANDIPKIRIFGSTVPPTSDFPNNLSSNPNSIQLFNPTIRFYNTVATPVITQDPSNSADAYAMTVAAQTATGSFKGGDLKLSSGASFLNTKDGYVRLQTGTIDRLFIDATANRATLTLNTFAFNGVDGLDGYAAVINPTIRQRNDITNSITGQLFTLRAQNTTGTSTIGGTLHVGSGSGTSADGYVRILTGNTTRMFYDATAGQATLTLNTFSFNGTDGYLDGSTNVIAPTIKQRTNTTFFGTGQPLTIQSQDVPNFGIAGDLIFKSGQGGRVEVSNGAASSYIRHGHILLKTGNDTRVGDFFIDGHGPYFSVGGTSSAPAAVDGYLRVPNAVTALSAAANSAFPPYAPNRTSIHLIGTNASNQILIGSSDGYDTVVIPGNLYAGTFNSSTVLEVEDRLIHANFNIAQAGTPINPPSMITGFTIHRGNSAVPVYNDEAGLIWVDGALLNATDGYWKAASVFHGDDLTLNNSLNIMGRSLSITDTPNPAFGSLPSVGGLRTINNSTAVASRNAAGTQNLLLLGTDGYDHITFGSPLNKGHVFDTAADGNYDFRVNGTSSAFIDGYKFAFTHGRRRHITPVSTTYQVLPIDDYLAITANTSYTIFMPASPIIGDAYEFKDINGTASTNNVMIYGNGFNIDGVSTFIMNTNFASFVLTYTSAGWSIS